MKLKKRRERRGRREPEFPSLPAGWILEPTPHPNFLTVLFPHLTRLLCFVETGSRVSQVGLELLVLHFPSAGAACVHHYLVCVFS